MNKMKLVKEYYEELKVIKHLESLEQTEKRQKRIKSKKEDLEDIQTDYYNEYPKEGIKITFDSALEEYTLFEKIKNFSSTDIEEGKFNYLHIKRQFEGKTKTEYQNYINSLYSAYKNSIDNIKSKGKVNLKNSNCDIISSSFLATANNKVIKEFFRLSYLDLKYMSSDNKESEKENKILIQFVAYKISNKNVFTYGKYYSVPLDKTIINTDLKTWAEKNGYIKAYWRKYEDFIN